MGVKEHHKPEVMNPITSYLLDIAQTYQIPVILLCHTNSEGGIYGKALSRKCEHQLALVFSNKHDITSPRNLKCIRSRHIEKTRTFGITYENHVFSYGEPHEMFDDANHAIQTRKESKADQDIAGMALILEKSDAKGIAIAEATSALKSEDRSEEAARKAAQRALQALCERGKAVKHEQKWYAAGFEPDSVA
jgi:predicted ATP-dependent serine protease